MASVAPGIEIPFAKFNAVGNDFLVVSGQALKPAFDRSHFLGQCARAACDRNAGVGADGLVLVLEPENKRHHARMRIFNADGSEAEISGNGIRCAAAFVALEGTSRVRREDKGGLSAALQIETAAGLRRVRGRKTADHAWTFQVAMGRPILKPSRIPFGARRVTRPVVDFPLSTSVGTFGVTVTSMGNPHCSVFVDSFHSFDWFSLGREIEAHPFFPRRTNVEFVRVVSRREIEVRFWERGVGKTFSSGTGACAAAVACTLNRRTGRRVRVTTEKGALEVAWPIKSEVMLTGPVDLVARGIYYGS